MEESWTLNLDENIGFIKDTLKRHIKSAFKPGQTVIYRPTNHKGDVYKEEVGIVKRMTESGNAAFVWYHSGCTAACTPIEYLEATPVTIAHTKIHHGCEECLQGDPEAIMEYLLDKTEIKEEI
jgi:hypothetical protein